MRGFGEWVWGLVGGILCFLLQGELRALFLRASEGLALKASLKIPAQVKERILEDWLADIESLGQEGRYFSQLGHAYQFYRNAWEIAWVAAQELPKIDQVELAAEYSRWCARWLYALLAFSAPISVLINIDLWLWDIPGFTISLTLAGMLASIRGLQFYFELGRVLKEMRFVLTELRAYLEEYNELEAIIEARKTALKLIAKPAIQ